MSLQEKAQRGRAGAGAWWACGRAHGLWGGEVARWAEAASNGTVTDLRALSGARLWRSEKRADAGRLRYR